MNATKIFSPAKKFAKDTITAFPHSCQVWSNKRIYLTLGSQAAGKSQLRRAIDSIISKKQITGVTLARACQHEPEVLPSGTDSTPALEMKRHMSKKAKHERSTYAKKNTWFNYTIDSIAAETLDSDYDWLEKRFKRHPEYIPVFVINGASASFFISKLIFIALIRDLQLKGATLIEAVKSTIDLMWSVELESVENHPAHTHILGLSEGLNTMDTSDISAVVVDGIPGFASESNQSVATALNNDIDRIIRIFVEREEAVLKKMSSLLKQLSDKKRKKAIIVVTRRDLVEGISHNDTIIDNGHTIIDSFDQLVKLIDPKKDQIPETNKFCTKFVEWKWETTLAKSKDNKITSCLTKTPINDENIITDVSNIMFDND